VIYPGRVVCDNFFEHVEGKNALMKVSELRKALAELRVLRRAVSIEGVDAKEEQYRLEKDGKYWITYYYERGNKNALREFSSEDEACDNFLEMLRQDPTARSP
jgi:RecB family exonuclease